MYVLEQVYDDDFFKRLTQDSNKMSDWFADILIDVFNPKNVIDVGCGTGQYIKSLKERNVNTIGIEGSKKAFNNLVCNKNQVVRMDLRKSIDTKKIINFNPSQLAICIEVAEHIEEEYSNIFIENLTKLSDTIVMTAAPPGQAGEGHVNCQLQGYWIEKFNKHGVEYDEKTTQTIKNKINEKKNLNNFVAFWFIHNIMVFRFTK